MTAINEKDLLAKAEAVIEHVAGGGALKGLVDIGDDELKAIYAVAYNHFTAGKYSQAIDLFKFLCLYDHTEPRWFHCLGAALQRKGEYAAAVDAFGAAVILDIDDPRPQAQAGYCLMALGKWPEAESALEGAIMTCGDDAGHAGIRRQAEAMLETAKARTTERKGTA